MHVVLGNEDWELGTNLCRQSGQQH
jgi:hypothetical protein